ncbi:MAG TPA: hypothetical protein PLI47_12925, partial [Bacteroidia bacterium]|nr:hypothetical protein [Bacteroidia bacterium]
SDFLTIHINPRGARQKIEVSQYMICNKQKLFSEVKRLTPCGQAPSFPLPHDYAPRRTALLNSQMTKFKS